MLHELKYCVDARAVPLGAAPWRMEARRAWRSTPGRPAALSLPEARRRRTVQGNMIYFVQIDKYDN